MNLEREPTFPPYEGDLSNQHLSFDQDQWKTNSQKGSCVSTELDSMENPPSSPDCVNGLSPYSEEITHRPDTVYSDSDDTVSNSQATTSLTWNQPSSEESYLEPPQGLYMDQEGRMLHRKLRPFEHMVNATGAGDAFTAAMIYATLEDMPIESVMDYAMAAGIAAVSHERTINPNMSVPLLEEILLAHRI